MNPQSPSLVELWPYVVILVGGCFATEIWRYLGVYVSGFLREGSEALNWVRAVATALIASLIARLILFPSGFLAESPLYLRFAAVGAGILCFKLANNRVLAGIAAAEFVLIVGWYFVLNG